MKQFRYFFEAAGIHIVLFLFSLLPPKAASATGGFLGKSIGPKLAASRKALRHLELSLPDREHHVILRDMWENLGRVFAEYPHLKTIAKNYTEIIGLENITRYSAGTPCVFISAHMANWEIGTSSLVMQNNIPVDIVYREPNNPFVQKILNKCRSIQGKLDTIPKSKTGTRKLISHLNKNRHIGIMIDQKYNEGIAVPFFGRPAMTSSAFVRLAQKFEAPLLPVQIQRIQGCHFKVIIYPPMDITGKAEEDVVSAAHQQLEEWIKEKPGQWLWLHRRWDSKRIEKNEL